MTREQIYKDIETGHTERMLNLKKYYPFFKLCDTSFTQFKGGKYAELDMAYIVMAILRFFIEENNFKEKDVTYAQYADFMKGFINHAFNKTYMPDELSEIAEYVFDKMKNDGKPFTIDYYDPEEKIRKTFRTKLIESRIQEGTVWYAISADAVEFYLDTKEVRDESRISIQQLLLEKMIQSRNFRGGTEVLEKINNEVALLMSQKREVLELLSTDVFAGAEAYKRFVNTGMKWFADEQRLFVKNKELIESVYAKAEKERDGSEKYYENLNEIYKLDTQLKISMNRHGELLKACTELKIMADEIIRRAKLRRLRNGMDFTGMFGRMIEADSTQALEAMVKPLLALNVRKLFNLTSVDDMLSYRPDREEKAEKVSKEKVKDIVYDDEIEEKRIYDNIHEYMKLLIEYIGEKSSFTLEEYIRHIAAKYGDKVVYNGDLYTFIVHLCQKKEYRFAKEEDKETFLDGILTDINSEADTIPFRILNDGEEIQIGENVVTNIRFERIEQ